MCRKRPNGPLRLVSLGLQPFFHLLVALALLAGAATGSPPRKADSLTTQTLTAGVPGTIFAFTDSLVGIEPGGRIRIVPFTTMCGGAGSMTMSPSVSPPCSGYICFGPSYRRGRNVSWNDVRIVNSGVYNLCWCEPSQQCAGQEVGPYFYRNGEGCCNNDADFSVFVGPVVVLGPSQVTLQPVLGKSFTLTLTGLGVNPNSQAILRYLDPILELNNCGIPRSPFELESTLIQPLDPVKEGFVAQNNTIYTRITITRRLNFTVCWCAGPCNSDEDFAAQVGVVLPAGPFTEEVPLQKTITGVVGSLAINGDALSARDLLLVLPARRASGTGLRAVNRSYCGTPGWEFTRAVAHQVCYRGGKCVPSPAKGGMPTRLGLNGVRLPLGRQSQVEKWEPVVFLLPGLYSLCWCMSDSWDAALVDTKGQCLRPEQFQVYAGDVLVEGVVADHVFPCTAYSSCAFVIKSGLPFQQNDSVMVLDNNNGGMSSCGSGAMGILITIGVFGKANITNTSKAGYFGNFFLPLTGSIDKFRLCYCNSAVNGPCNEPVAFAQHVGFLNVTASLMVPGKSGLSDSNPGDQVCQALWPCTIKIHGIWAMQLNRLDAFVAVPTLFLAPGQSACATLQRANLTNASFMALRLASRALLALGAWEAVFNQDAPTMLPAGDYRLCYCIALLGSPPDCSKQRSFQHEVGGLQVVGASIRGNWTCVQGLACNISVLGWRISTSDLVRVVDRTTDCGAADPDGAALPLGFTRNPAPVATLNFTAVGHTAFALFSFGQVLGAGTWKVCLCTTADPTTPCTRPEHYLQDIGVLSVPGAIDWVMPMDKATTNIIPLVISVSVPTRITCVASSTPQATVPSIVRMKHCVTMIRGCLAIISLTYRALEGINSFFIPVQQQALQSAGNVSTVYVWCTPDVEQCQSGFCSMPPTTTGLALPLLPGLLPWPSPVVGTRMEPFQIDIFGDPLNTADGQFKVVLSSSSCEVGRDQLLPGPSPYVQDKVSWSFLDAVIASPGYYLGCWCDRFSNDDGSCIRWQRVGSLLVAGPTTTSPLAASLRPGKDFLLNVTGVNLTQSMDRLVIVPGSTCLTNLTYNATLFAPMRSNGTVARWNLTAPLAEGPFSICWGRQYSSSVVVAQLLLVTGKVVDAQDCVLSPWSAVPPTSVDLSMAPFLSEVPEPNCSRLCGGGLRQFQRSILSGARGVGIPCPPDSALQSSEPCNTQPCPNATVSKVLASVPASPVVSWNGQKGMAVVISIEGLALDPTQDYVAIVGSGTPCGATSTDFAAAPCSRSGSNGSHVVCGDGSSNIWIDRPGDYRICYCDASASQQNHSAGGQGLTDGDTARVAPCKLFSDFNTSLPSGASFTVPALAWSSANNTLAQDTSQEAAAVLSVAALKSVVTGQSSNIGLLVGLAVSGAVVFHLLLFIACWCRWRCRRRVVPKVARSASEILVEKATKDAWEAYSRTIKSHMTGEDPEDQCGELPLSPQQTTDPNELPTPPTTAGSMTSTGSKRSRPSLLRVDLSSSRPPTPIAVGSFLNRPLMGRPSALTSCYGSNSPRLGTPASISHMAGLGRSRPSSASSMRSSPRSSGERPRSGSRTPSVMSSPREERPSSPEPIRAEEPPVKAPEPVKQVVVEPVKQAIPQPMLPVPMPPAGLLKLGAVGGFSTPSFLSSGVPAPPAMPPPRLEEVSAVKEEPPPKEASPPAVPPTPPPPLLLAEAPSPQPPVPPEPPEPPPGLVAAEDVLEVVDERPPSPPPPAPLPPRPPSPREPAPVPPVEPPEPPSAEPPEPPPVEPPEPPEPAPLQKLPEPPVPPPVPPEPSGGDSPEERPSSKPRGLSSWAQNRAKGVKDRPRAENSRFQVGSSLRKTSSKSSAKPAPEVAPVPPEPPAPEPPKEEVVQLAPCPAEPALLPLPARSSRVLSPRSEATESVEASPCRLDIAPTPTGGIVLPLEDESSSSPEHVVRDFPPSPGGESSSPGGSWQESEGSRSGSLSKTSLRPDRQRAGFSLRDAAAASRNMPPSPSSSVPEAREGSKNESWRTNKIRQRDVGPQPSLKGSFVAGPALPGPPLGGSFNAFGPSAGPTLSQGPAAPTARPFGPGAGLSRSNLPSWAFAAP